VSCSWLLQDRTARVGHAINQIFVDRHAAPLTRQLGKVFDVAE
jgi:hypothetical protein